MASSDFNEHFPWYKLVEKDPYVQDINDKGELLWINKKHVYNNTSYSYPVTDPKITYATDIITDSEYWNKSDTEKSNYNPLWYVAYDNTGKREFPNTIRLYANEQAALNAGWSTKAETGKQYAARMDSATRFKNVNVNWVLICASYNDSSGAEINIPSYAFYESSVDTVRYQKSFMKTHSGGISASAISMVAVSQDPILYYFDTDCFSKSKIVNFIYRSNQTHNISFRHGVFDICNSFLRFQLYTSYATVYFGLNVITNDMLYPPDFESLIIHVNKLNLSDSVNSYTSDYSAICLTTIKNFSLILTNFSAGYPTGTTGASLLDAGSEPMYFINFETNILEQFWKSEKDGYSGQDECVINNERLLRKGETGSFWIQGSITNVLNNKNYNNTIIYAPIGLGFNFIKTITPKETSNFTITQAPPRYEFEQSDANIITGDLKFYVSDWSAYLEAFTGNFNTREQLILTWITLKAINTKYSPIITNQNGVALQNLTIELSDSVKTIPKSAFAYLGKSNQSLCIKGAKISTIEEEAFAYSGFNKITINPPNTINYDGSYINIKTIGKNAFLNCQIKSLFLDQGIATINQLAFKNCTKLETLYYNCPDLDSSFNKGRGAIDAAHGNWIFENIGTDVPDGSDGAKYGCRLYFGPNVKIIPTAFMYPAQLEQHDWTKGYYPSLTTISLFEVANNKNINVTNVKNNSITEIKDSAFKYINRSKGVSKDSDLHSLTFLRRCQALTVIGGSAFAGIDSIEKISFSPKLNTIGDNCFRDCPNITDIIDEFPDSLIHIHPRAFGGVGELNVSDATEALKNQPKILKETQIGGSPARLVYVKDKDGHAWLLHHYTVQDTVSRRIELPQEERIVGISEKACANAMVVLTYSKDLNKYNLFNTNSRVRIIDNQAFYETDYSFLSTDESANADFDISVNLSYVKYVGKSCFRLKSLDSRTSSYKFECFDFDKNQPVLHTTSFTLGKEHIVNSEDNFICEKSKGSTYGSLYFKEVKDLYYYCTNNKNINEQIGIDKIGIANYRYPIWQIRLIQSEQEYLIQELSISNNKFTVTGKKSGNNSNKSFSYAISGNCAIVPYSLYNADLDKIQIDLSICNLTNSYLIGSQYCQKTENSESYFFSKGVEIRFTNGYANGSARRLDSTVFSSIPTEGPLFVNTLQLPYWYLDQISSSVYLTKCKTYIIDTNPNDEESSEISESKFRIIPNTIENLTIPLSPYEIGLNNPSHPITHPKPETAKDADGNDIPNYLPKFSHLKTVTLTKKIFKDRPGVIGPNSFEQANSLEKIYLSADLEQIGVDAFKSTVEKLVEVHYGDATTSLKWSDWYQIQFANHFSTPFGGKSWSWINQEDNNYNFKAAYFYLNGEKQHKPRIEILENDTNKTDILVYDTKPFYNYPMSELVFPREIMLPADTYKLWDDSERYEQLDVTGALNIVTFTNLNQTSYSFYDNVLKNYVPGISTGSSEDLQRYNLQIIDLSSENIVRIPDNMFKDCFSTATAPIILVLNKAVEYLGKNAFSNTFCILKQKIDNAIIRDSTTQQLYLREQLLKNCFTALEFLQLQIANNCGILPITESGTIAGNNWQLNNLYSDKYQAYFYNNGKYNFCTGKIEGDVLNLSEECRVIDYQTIWPQQFTNMTIPWIIPSQVDAKYVTGQMTQLLNWFALKKQDKIIEIKDLTIKNTDAIYYNPVYIQEPGYIYGCNMPQNLSSLNQKEHYAYGTFSTFANIKITNKISLQCPSIKGIVSNIQHFPLLSNNFLLPKIELIMDVIPQNLFVFAEDFGVHELEIKHNKDLETAITIESNSLLLKTVEHIYFNFEDIMDNLNQYNQLLIMKPNAFVLGGIDTGIYNIVNNDTITTNLSLAQWAQYIYFTGDFANPLKAARQFYTNKNQREYSFIPNGSFNDNQTAYTFYINSYALQNNYQIVDINLVPPRVNEKLFQGDIIIKSYSDDLIVHDIFPLTGRIVEIYNGRNSIGYIEKSTVYNSLFIKPQATTSSEISTLENGKE